jgi:hypothetical protein
MEVLVLDQRGLVERLTEVSCIEFRPGAAATVRGDTGSVIATLVLSEGLSLAVGGRADGHPEPDQPPAVRGRKRRRLQPRRRRRRPSPPPPAAAPVRVTAISRAEAASVRERFASAANTGGQRREAGTAVHSQRRREDPHRSVIGSQAPAPTPQKAASRAGSQAAERAHVTSGSGARSNRP